MIKVIRLVRIQLGAVLSDMLSIGNHRNKKSRRGYGGLIAFLTIMTLIAFLYCYMIGKGLMIFDSLHLLPTMMMAVSSILALFFIPMVPIIFASILGVIISFAASRFRYRNLVYILFSIVAFLWMMGLSMTVSDSGQELVNLSYTLTEQVNRMYPLAKLYTKATVYYDGLALCLFLLISLLLFLAYCYGVGKVFLWLNTMFLTGHTGTKFTMGRQKVQSPLGALYRKELRRFFASPVYVLNTGFGIVLLTFGVLFLLLVKSPFARILPWQFDLNTIRQIPELEDMVRHSGPLIISFCVLLSSTTMASISLEGNNLWILKSLPLSPGTIFRSKMAVNFTITAPALIDAILLSILLELEMIYGLILVLLSIVFSIFVAVFGLLVNLKFPNFSWTSETFVIKQSKASTISVFSGLGIMALQFLLQYIIPSYEMAYLAYLIIFAVLDIVIYRILMTYGVRRFQEL